MAEQSKQQFEAALALLREKYRERLGERLQILRRGLAELEEGDRSAGGRIRGVAHQLHGNGSTYGYPEISETAARVEGSPTRRMPRKLRSLIDVLQGVVDPQGRRDRAAQADEDGRDAPSRGRILFVDDDPLLSAMAKHRLCSAGFEVDHYADGLSGLRAALSESYDLCLLDVCMPGLDGFELLERLGRLPHMHSVPLVMLTALDEESEIVRAFELGADDYIVKPFRPKELVARISRLLTARNRTPRTPDVAGCFAGGQLREFLGMLALNERSGRLSLQVGGSAGHVDLRLGRVVDAEWDGARGLAAALELFAREEGSFRYDPAEPDEVLGASLLLPVDALLQEVARRQDPFSS